MKRRFIVLWMLIALCWAGPAWTREVITLGVVTTPGSAQNVCADKFKELLESRSDRYEVKILHSGSIGAETEILHKIQTNAIQMGVVTSGPFDAFLPAVRVIDYPFLFKDYHEVDRVLDGSPGRELLSHLESVGFKGLAFSENGFRHLSNNKRPVHTVTDVAGLRIRVMESALHRELWRLLGADPVSLEWPINKELRKGLIDAQENPLSVLWTYRLFEVQKHLTLTGHVYSAHIDVASLKWFQSLASADQEMIQQCMQEAAKYQRAWNRTNAEGFLAC